MSKVEQRFDEKVSRSSSCWIWTARTNGRGYGMFFREGREVRAHRFALERVKGPIAPGLEVDHLCRNTLCVRPDHLEAVTHQENVRRGRFPEIARQRQLRKTHCPAGHRYAGFNLVVNIRGHRVCRTCQRRPR